MTDFAPNIKFWWVWDWATSSKQDEIIQELVTLNTTDFSTEAKQNEQITLQETLNNLTNWIYDLTQLLAFLPSVRWVLADLRVTPLSTPNMNTLSTLSNQTSIWWFIATPQIPAMMNLSWQNNINNVTIT